MEILAERQVREKQVQCLRCHKTWWMRVKRTSKCPYCGHASWDKKQPRNYRRNNPQENK